MTTTTITSDQLQENVQQIFADVTRYPMDILAVDANLEEDLGIDSVKLGEVFSVIREQYDIPTKMDIPEEQLKTIGGITEALAAYLKQQKNGAISNTENSNSEVVQQEGSNKNQTSNTTTTEDLQTKVLKIFQQVTRYPMEVLDVEANLEEDLGIDSVKLGEVFSVIREEYDIPEKLDIPEEQLKTITGITTALAQFIQQEDTTKQTQKPVKIKTIIHSNGNDSSNNIEQSNTTTASTNAQPFEGKIAFISGSGRGLGKDIAQYLASLGAKVYVNSFHSRNQGEATVEAIKKNGGQAIHLWGSVANSTQLHEMFDEIEAAGQGLDFFISNASNGMLAKLEDITPEHWEKAFRTNVIGFHQGALRAAKMMRQNGGGKIISLSSPASQGYVDYFGCMGAVKAAIESLTRSLAVEFAPDHIQVNCVSPGPIKGELINKWPDKDRLIPRWEANTMYDRICEARDVSHFIAYLLSDKAALFNASTLVMDGGISVKGW